MNLAAFLNRPDLSPGLVLDAFEAASVPLPAEAAAGIVANRAGAPYLSAVDVLARNRQVAPAALTGFGDAIAAGQMTAFTAPIRLLAAYFAQPDLVPARVDRDFEIAGRDIGPVTAQALIAAGRAGLLASEADIDRVPGVGPKRLQLMLAAAASGQLFMQAGSFDTLFFLDDGEREGIGRTVVRTNCNIGNTYFGINFYGRVTRQKDGAQYEDFFRLQEKVKGKWRDLKRRLAQLRPQLGLNSNCEIGVAVTADVRGDYKGDLLVEVFRDVGPDTSRPLPANQPDPKLRRTVREATDLKDLRAKGRLIGDIRVTSPKPLGAGRQRKEHVAVRCTWKPEVGDPCSITERFVIVWVGAADRRYARYKLPKGLSTTTKPYVLVDSRVSPPDEDDDPKVHTIDSFTYFPVDLAKGCCGAAKSAFAVIQFVRHEYKLKGQAREKDRWSLDILGSEIDRATNGQDYDPTYTLDPCDRLAKAREAATDQADKDAIVVPPPVVYPGPDTNLKPAITLVDAPGFSQELFDLMLERGIDFSWHFYSFLVCRLADCKAGAYLKDGKVRAYLRHSIKVTFTRRRKKVSVKVSSTMTQRIEVKPCRPLKEVIDEIDKKRKAVAGSAAEGTLLEGFRSPREHRIQVRRRR